MVEIYHTQCKLQWPALKNMGQDPLLYLVQLTRVPGTSTTKPSNESASIADYGAAASPEPLNGEEEAVTVYRGAETSCTVSNLLPGTNYIARVCAIRCCQTEPPEQLLSKDQEAIALQASLSNSASAKIVLLHGPFSVGTAFTTLPEKRTPVGEFINSMWRRSTVVKRPAVSQQQTPPLTSQQEKSSSVPMLRRVLALSSLSNNFNALYQRLRAFVLLERPSGGHSTISSRDRAQCRMAFLVLICFVLVTLFCAWFANQFLLHFSDDSISSAVKWTNGAPGGGGAAASLEDSSPSARAALYATRGRQHHQ